MTPQQHLDQAESLLAKAGTLEGPEYRSADVYSVLGALAHATIALAIEVGVPHVAAPAGGAGSAATG